MTGAKLILYEAFVDSELGGTKKFAAPGPL